MEIQIYAQGNGFKASSSELKSLITLLGSYENTYSQCLKVAAEKYKVIPAQMQASVRLRELKPGSAVIRTITDVANAIAPLAPLIFNHAWLLYKSGYDLIGIATRYFKESNEPMRIEIKDSPGASVNIVNGDQCVVTPDVFLIASASQKGFTQYANMIEKKQANQIDIHPIEHPEKGHLSFNKQNYKDYKGHSRRHIDESLVNLECNIIRFNKRTLKGALEVYVGETSVTKPFLAHPSIMTDCLDAFKARRITVVAKRELEVNALGESSVISYHAIEVRAHE